MKNTVSLLKIDSSKSHIPICKHFSFLVTLPLEANSAVVVLWEPKAARVLRVKVAIPTDKRKTREYLRKF